MTTVIRNASAADLLANLPALAGTTPRNSLVLLGFRGKRTHATLRFDLPSRGYGRFASTVIGLFCKIPEVDGVVPVICTDAPFASDRDLLSLLLRRFEQAGFGVKDALIVGCDGWGSYFDPDVPPAGRPLGEIEPQHRAPTVPARVPSADELTCRRMTVELARLYRLAEGEEVDSIEAEETDELDELADLPFLAENALAWDAADITSSGALLLFALKGPPVRDLVMLQWAFGLELGDAMWSADTCFGMEARKTYANVDVQAADLMMGHGPRPSTERVEAAIALLTTLISRSDDTHRKAPLCMLAWLNWALGRGSVAGIHIDEVRAIDPEYSMGELLNTLFSRGELPEWLFTSPQIPPTV
ncbi:MAG: DUF4192 domain-containing protein [Salinibacterium sp.]|nr:DUF4192 domain-containing protein [Salinibacterium sp.]